jgi:hypothetical protein
MKLSSLTYLGFETNAVLDAHPDFQLPFAEIHAAARERRLVEYLTKRFGDKADLSMFQARPDELIDVEMALADAAGGLEGRESRKTGVANNGVNLVLALIFEAIQQQFISLTPSAETATATAN